MALSINIVGACADARPASPPQRLIVELEDAPAPCPLPTRLRQLSGDRRLWGGALSPSDLAGLRAAHPGAVIRSPWPLSSPRPPALAAIAGGAPPPPALVGRAAEAHGHAAWAAAGFDGRGVTIAVIDVGFDGLDALPVGARPRAVRPVAGLRLPAEGAPGQAHGAAVVEVLGRLSPGVEVWTAPVADELDLLEAMAAISALQPDLVVASLGFDNIWAADGTSPVARAVDALVDETGAVWVAAAGNERGRYRRGLVTDHDQDGLLEIDGEEGLSLRARDGDLAARLRNGGPTGPHSGGGRCDQRL